jgi:uncharacterized protein (DUF2267 family)
MMSYEHLVGEVQLRAGFETPEEAERVIAVAARVLGERLLPDEVGPLAASLPDQVAARLRVASYSHDFDVDELYDRVGRGEGAGRGFGREHTQAVCQVLGEALPEAVRTRLQRHLGPAFAALFEPRPVHLAPPRPVHGARAPEAGEGHTLATGRLGSHHPLSEGDGDRAQAESVARSTDPHGDTKLSSSRGLTQERLRETLATGKPGPSAPVNDTKR